MMIKLPQKTVEYALTVLADRLENLSHFAHFSSAARTEITQHINILNEALPKSDNVSMWICPRCGDIVTEDDITRNINEGGFGACMCAFGNGSRILIQYEKYDPDNPFAFESDFSDLVKVIEELEKKVKNNR